MRKQRKLILAALVLLVGIVMIGVQYVSFVSQMIYRENVSHLTEIFHQAFTSLNSLVHQNWTNLHTCAGYLQDVSDEKQIETFLARQQAEFGFTDFYFISSGSGDFLTASGKKGYFDLKDGLPE